MVHLPPKSREEDAEHLERWKALMEESRMAGSSDIVSLLYLKLTLTLLHPCRGETTVHS